MGTKTILIIEDEPQQVDMITIRLEANGFKVIHAADGAEGLQKAYDTMPDLVILDIVMPKLDGFQVCSRLKGDDKTKKIPIIILTASGKKDLEEKCVGCGAEVILRKPYDSKQLVDTVKSFV
ncbi:MAG: response regulator [Candidatus Omnitrophota bacterium]